MEKIAIISDIHANITALKTVMNDIASRNISRIFCLGDYVTKSCNPDLVIDLVKEKCEVALKGNCDDLIASVNPHSKSFWSRIKIGEERAEFLRNLPVYYDFYMSGYLIRLFHSSPYSLSHIFNPMFSNSSTNRQILSNPLSLFENTDFLNIPSDSPVPDIIGYGHIHTPNIFRYKNKTIFNTGSIGSPVEMSNSNNINDVTNKFSTLSSYIILEGEYNSKDLSSISLNIVRLPYNIEEEIKFISESDLPEKDKLINCLRTASQIN